MLENKTIDKLRNLLNQEEEGNLFNRLKIRKKKRELKKKLCVLEMTMLDYYKNKIEKEIKNIKEETKKNFISEIKKTAKQQEYKGTDILSTFPEL